MSHTKNKNLLVILKSVFTNVQKNSINLERQHTVHTVQYLSQKPSLFKFKYSFQVYLSHFDIYGITKTRNKVIILTKKQTDRKKKTDTDNSRKRSQTAKKKNKKLSANKVQHRINGHAENE